MRTTLADHIADINQSVISPDMVSLPIGRGYRLGEDYTDDAVHVAAVVPSFLLQGRLLREFSYASVGKSRPDLYLGVGGVMNLSYIAALRPKQAVLLDVNPVQTLFWQQLFDDINQSGSVRAFQKSARHMEDKALTRLQDAFGARGFDTTANIETLIQTKRLTRSSVSFADFLKTQLPDRYWVLPENYSLLRQMVDRGDIAALTLDLADSEGCEQLAELLDASQAKADYVHVSNVLDFMKGVQDWVGRDGSADLFNRTVQNMRMLSKPADTVKVITDSECVSLSDLQSVDL